MVELQYGAGAKSIARNNGLDIKQAQGFIDRYYDRYNVLKKYQEQVMAEAKALVRPSELRSPSGIPLGVAKWQSSTGRIYTFVEQEAPQFLQERGILTSISPTHIANYPMQGFATGDVVPEVLGALWRRLAGQNSCLPINTVHDSVLFDVEGASLGTACIIIKSVMESAPALMEERFGIKIDLPLKVDIEYGHDWATMKKYDV